MTQKSLTVTPESESEISLAVNAGAIALAKRMELVRHVISQMEDGIHYGASFPGDKKKNLLKPGADYLGVAFRLVPTYDVERIDLPGGHREYSVNCRVTGPDGSLVTNGLGSCSTMESKYRWRNANRKCPMCGQEAIIKGKADYGGGWICFERKGGCKARFGDNDPAITEQVTGKVENTDPADQFNTCLKIAKKRAGVDAMITATGCSADFTQDAEDMRDEAVPVPVTPKAATPTSTPSPAALATPAPAMVLGVEGLALALEGSDSFQALQKAWGAVLEVQSKIASSDLTRLLKLRRAAELKWGAL